MRIDSLEISDLIVDFDPATLQRRPVLKQKVVEHFRLEGNANAARIVEGIAEREGVLDPAAVDRLLVSAHFEIQRLSEEFDHGRRAMEMLSPMLSVLRARGLPLRIADVGCGTGYVIRWLAAHAGWADVELCGADFNPALVGEATRLAEAEGLGCRFRVANAFALAEPASVITSTGVLHHFRGEGLERFFAQHQQPATQAFVHFDFQPSAVAPVGAWLLHVARMRLPLSRHDGVLSAVRAHPGDQLLAAARAGAKGFEVSLFGQRLGATPLPRAFQAVVGVRPELREALVQALGKRASRLGGFG